MLNTASCFDRVPLNASIDRRVWYTEKHFRSDPALPHGGQRKQFEEEGIVQMVYICMYETDQVGFAIISSLAVQWKQGEKGCMDAASVHGRRERYIKM